MSEYIVFMMVLAVIYAGYIVVRMRERRMMNRYYGKISTDKRDRVRKAA